MTKQEILEKVGFDLDKAKAINDWLNDEVPSEMHEERPSATEHVSINYDAEGNPDGVRVCAHGEDFIIELHDGFDGTEVKWDEIAKNNANTFSFHQAAVTCECLDEINDKLVEAGGESLKDRWYWTNAEYDAIRARVFRGTGGSLSYGSKYSRSRVRFLASV